MATTTQPCAAGHRTGAARLASEWWLVRIYGGRIAARLLRGIKWPAPPAVGREELPVMFGVTLNR
jgi:hypothetical protein